MIYVTYISDGEDLPDQVYQSMSGSLEPSMTNDNLDSVPETVDQVVVEGRNEIKEPIPAEATKNLSFTPVKKFIENKKKS